MTHVALCMMVKGTDDEAPLLDQCLKSVAKHVDGIYIQINVPKSESVSPKVRRVAEKYTSPENIEVVPWTGNFATARNANFSQVPKKYSHILWLDSDDTVENPEKIEEVAAIMPANVEGLLIEYDYAHDQHGNVSVSHWVYRLVRNTGSFRWSSSFEDEEFGVHENLSPVRTVATSSNDEFKVVHHATGERIARSLIRNVALLEKMYEQQIKKGTLDPRVQFYLGTHYFDLGRYDDTIDLLSAYLKKSGWGTERSVAHVFIGKIMRKRERNNQARSAFLFALGEDPENTEAYLELGKLEAETGRYNEALSWLEKAKEPKDGPHTIVRFTRNYELYFLMSEVLVNIGGKRLTESLKWANKALKLRPLDPLALEARDKIEGVVGYQKDMTAVARIIRHLRKKETDKIVPFLNALPADLADSPVVIGARLEFVPEVKWPKKSIALYVGAGAMGIWGPWSLEEGIGGSEEAVIQLSRELATLGWYVTVYATPGERAGFEEVPFANPVEWKQYWELNPDDEFDVLIAWRNPGFFNSPWKARKKYVWMHDVMPEAEFDASLKNLDKVIMLSKYQRSLFPNIPDDKIFMSANGIVPEDFDIKAGKRDPHRIIYMSSHVRGLELLYNIWPEVKKAVPKATLDIYYGWDSFVNILKDNPDRMAWRERMIKKAKELEGVTDHGKISHGQIVSEIFKSGVWAYPCVTGDTLVDMPRNYQQYPLGIPIRKLVGKKGFPVWSYNVETGKFELKNVNWVALTRKKAKIIKINWTDGTSLRCTPDHKIYTYKRGWIEAKDLLPDESVVALKKHMMVQVSAGQRKWPYEHRMIAEYLQGEIPKSHHVHHIDGNCFNNSPENLEILSPSEHAAQTHKEQYSTRPLIDRRNTARYNHKVESIEEAGYENVYDMNVEDNHNFIAGGVVVHNCPFPEVYCITAIKAQAGGAVPVSSNFAALDETVKYGAKIPLHATEEDASISEWKPEDVAKFKKALIDMLKDPAKQEEIRPAMMKWARTQSWEKVAKSWDSEMI